VSVTPASLIAAYPEWTQVNTSYPTVVTTAITVGENRVDEGVVGDRYDEAVMLAAGEWLYNHPYSRDMRSSSDADSNPYQILLDALLIQKGSAWRSYWEESDFGSYGS
jgi:hypothetical protein